MMLSRGSLGFKHKARVTLSQHRRKGLNTCAHADTHPQILGAVIGQCRRKFTPQISPQEGLEGANARQRPINGGNDWGLGPALILTSQRAWPIVEA